MMVADEKEGFLEEVVKRRYQKESLPMDQRLLLTKEDGFRLGIKENYGDWRSLTFPVRRLKGRETNQWAE